MTKTEAIRTLWEYLHLHHTLEPASVIIALGSRDISVAERAAELWISGYAPLLVCSGSGDIHNHKPGRELFVGTTEAHVFAEIAIRRGVPKEKILVEDKSNNTEENIRFSLTVLAKHGIVADSYILVHKPYMERRTYATAKVWLPKETVLVTSPQTELDSYTGNKTDPPDWWIHVMVGDFERIKEYPKLGYQIPQEIPSSAEKAFQTLLGAGYTGRRITHSIT